MLISNIFMGNHSIKTLKKFVFIEITGDKIKIST